MIKIQKTNLNVIQKELKNITDNLGAITIPNSPEIHNKLSEVNQGLNDLLEQLQGDYGFAA